MARWLARTRNALRRREDDPSPWWAFAVGAVYLFRTAPGHRVLRDLERAVRKYAADPAALWRLVRDADEIIDAPPTRELED
jgi:hypothetical protein